MYLKLAVSFKPPHLLVGPGSSVYAYCAGSALFLDVFFIERQNIELNRYSLGIGAADELRLSLLQRSDELGMT
jgi:hypothetical protein